MTLRKITGWLTILTILFALHISLVAKAETMAVLDWYKAFLPEFQKLVCQPSEPLMKDYNVSQKECRRFVEIIVTTCMRVHQDIIPEMFDMPSDSEKWGEWVGDCTGRTYKVLMSSPIRRSG